MDYAMKSLSLLTPGSLSKCVSQQLTRAPQPKPFRVTSADRSLKKGIMADGLQDLVHKVMASLHVTCFVALVLDEDGTAVDTEEFFQTLPNSTDLMVLEKGQQWMPSQISPPRTQHSDCTPQRKKDVARLTFDLYKNHPQDFIGVLNVKATLYGVYSVSYSIRCYAAKTILKEALRWTLFSMQATGHILLGSSCYIEQLLEEEEKAEKCLALPQPQPQNKIQQLQRTLLGRAGLWAGQR